MKAQRGRLLLSQTEFKTAADAAMRSEAKNTSVVAVAAAASASMNLMWLPNPHSSLGCPLTVSPRAMGCVFWLASTGC